METKRDDTKQKESIPEMRYRVWPMLMAGGGSVPTEGRLYALAADLGFGVVPYLRRVGEHRPATEAELAEVVQARPLGALYRANLARAAAEANLLTVGDPGIGGSRFVYLDTGQPGIESLVLLPEVWDAARRALGGREPWLALPDRQHCRFLPAGPWRLVVEMAPDLDGWHRQSGEPLFDRLLRRQDSSLSGGPRFADLSPSGR